MKKTALLFWLFTLSLFACNPAFESCLAKVRDVAQVSGSFVSIPISKTKKLIYSTKPLKGALKSDPFLHIYLLKNKRNCKYPFKINKELPSNKLASIHKTIVCGEITKKQEGLSRLGEFSTPIKTPSVIMNGCCFIEAIGTPKGVISKKFINHFLRHGGVYGDVGVRLQQCKKGVVVQYVNPFLHTPFKAGDILLSLNGKKVANAAKVSQLILFLQPGSVCDVKVKRCKKVETLKVHVAKRVGGGYVSDTFLESLGIFLNKELRVLNPGRSELKKGDIITMVASKKVQTFADIKDVLSHIEQEPFLVGVNRNGFVFFIKIQTKI